MGIPPWSPTGVLIHRLGACVQVIEREPQFSPIYDRMYQEWSVTAE